MSELISAVKNLQSARATKMEFSPEPVATIPVHKTRRKGKRSDPSFEQVTAYIRKDTYLKAKMAVLQEGRDFSDLVEDLLCAYLRTQQVGLAATRTAGQ